MPKFPTLQDKDVVRLLLMLGFVEKRQTGSHKVFKHPDGRRAVVAMHAGHDIPPGTLKAIFRDIGLQRQNWEEFFS